MRQTSRDGIAAWLIILLLAASLMGGCGDEAVTTSQPSPSPSLGPPSLVPSQADWQQTDTFRSSEYGFSFDYDPDAFKVEGFFYEELGSPTVYAIRDESPALMLAFIVLPSSDIRKTAARELERYKRENPGSSYSEPTTISLNGRPAVAFEWFMEADESVAVDSVLRVYVVAGTYFVYEIVLEVPEGQWPEMWPAYEGVIASFAAE